MLDTYVSLLLLSGVVLTSSPPLTRLSPSQHGGTSLSIWDPSLSRVPISVICPDTSVVMLRLTLSCRCIILFPSRILIGSAKSVEFYEQPGKLSKVPVDESKIPEEDRIPRITTAVWYVLLPIAFTLFFSLLSPISLSIYPQPPMKGADEQEIQERCCWKLHPCCRSPGHCLRL